MPSEKFRSNAEEADVSASKKGSICEITSKAGKQSRAVFESLQDGGDNHSVIQHIRLLLSRISPSVRRMTVSVSRRWPSMTYEQLAEHIISLRTEHIQKLARPVVLKFYTHPRNFNIFNEPVDPVLHNLPTYWDVIKQPMDLGTIKCRLNASFYENLSDCFDDVRLVFNNAILFNGPDSFVGKAAREMLTEFEADVAGLEDKNNKNVSLRP